MILCDAVFISAATNLTLIAIHDINDIFIGHFEKMALLFSSIQWQSTVYAPNAYEYTAIGVENVCKKSIVQWIS